MHRRANVCLETASFVLQAYPTAEHRKKKTFTQPLSLLLSASYQSHHKIFHSKLSFWKTAGKRPRLERNAPTVTQQYAASSQPFCNRRLKDEHDFHLLSFTLQQKCLECLEMGSPAYLRSNVFTVILPIQQSILIMLYLLPSLGLASLTT